MGTSATESMCASQLSTVVLWKSDGNGISTREVAQIYLGLQAYILDRAIIHQQRVLHLPRGSGIPNVDS